ncbi:hypothetical protein [Agromyces sp. LHK192]|uniref:hypothetical protein n=1 Tax=Agromyces sp. LHK192 TaxID=2498704 RepID=UPI0013E2FB1F|nr:hypothetical protein [Agromyces sp. LHK192]
MKKQIQIAALALLAAGSLALTACTGPDLSNAKRLDAPAEETAAAEPAGTEAEAADEEGSSAGAAVEGELLQPGQTVALGQWGTYEYESYDGRKAVLNTKLVSIEPATQAQVDFLVAEIPELADYEVTLIRYQQQKVSGDDITYDANYTDFRPADVTGAQAQEVSVIGWDECASESFTEEFGAGAVIDQCVVGAKLPSSEAIGGMIWTGNSSADENPFSEYDGQPVFFKG